MAALPPDARFLIVTGEEARAARVAHALKGLEGREPELAAPSAFLEAWLREPPDLVLVDVEQCSAGDLKCIRQVAGSTPLLGFNPRRGRSGEKPGAEVDDYLARSARPEEVRARVRTLLHVRALEREVIELRRRLDARAEQRIDELEGLQSEIIERLAVVAEYRDDATHAHTQRVARLAALLAKQLGLAGGQVALIRQTAALHDIGKIAVPDHILLKPGPLTPEEFERVKEHTVIGARMLSQSRFPLLRQAAVIARTHHERWDGRGYPDGLRGEEIPIEGRIVAVADTWDVLTHERPYKRAWDPGDAIEEMRRVSGGQFDPEVVERFLMLWHAGAAGMSGS